MMRATELATIRASPARYSNVKSKVARCIKVANKAVKKQRMQRNKDKFANTMGTGDISNIHGDNNNCNSFISGHKQLNEALSVEQLGMSWNQKNSSW
jgi:hypothetical protein